MPLLNDGEARIEHRAACDDRDVFHCSEAPRVRGSIPYPINVGARWFRRLCLKMPALWSALETSRGT